MDEIIERIPQLEDKIYIIGGPRQQALEEALTLVLGILDKHYLSTEFFCQKDTPETIQNLFNEIAAAKGLGKGGRAYFTTIKICNVEAIHDRMWGSKSRRFVRLVFIDSLEAMHNRGEKFDRGKVLQTLPKYCPVIVVSEELAPTGSDTGQYDSNGAILSLTIK